jgi:mono/diheme cytochrome c family protein
MKRLGFWLITALIILGAYLTLPRDSESLPQEYATVNVPNDMLDSYDAITRGREIFLSNCVPCHGLAGNGQGTIKPTFGPPPADFTDRARRQTRSPQYLFWRVSEGGQVEPFRSQGSIMPAWKFRLSEPQRWQVVAYLRTLAP